jgi:ribonuclease P protein component
MAFAPEWRPRPAVRSWRAGAPKGALASPPDDFRRSALSDGDGGRRDQRFRRDHRLRHKADFARVFNKNVRSADRYFTVLARSTRTARPRLGMAISMRAAGGAVTRNRLKRLVRESFRCNHELLPAVDIVIMARPEASKADRQRLRRSLRTHWQRIAAQCNVSSSS